MSLPHQLWKYHESHKMWIFDFETYEHVISTLSSTNFPIVVSIEELPAFLVKGITAIAVHFIVEVDVIVVVLL